MVALSLSLLSAAFFLPLPLQPPTTSLPRTAVASMQMGGLGDDFANDGGEIDWDQEAAKLAKPMNEFYKKISDIEAKELIGEFAKTAPKTVQFAVKTTVASLLGNMPEQVAQASITTTGQNLATLMFNMQMTGYMFRNAEYRQSLVSSLDKSLSAANDEAKATGALPPVSGTVHVKIAEGMEAEVDAAAYMAELREEVEGLRAELARASKGGGGENEAALIQYIQTLDRKDQQQLTSDVSPEVLEAMSQLVATILIDLNIERDMETAAPADKVRELLIWQLVSGYKLREMEQMESLKDNYWGKDGDSEFDK